MLHLCPDLQGGVMSNGARQTSPGRKFLTIRRTVESLET
jgi:hypothetical protein